MIAIKIDDVYWLCEIELPPIMYSMANVIAYEEKAHVAYMQKKAKQELEIWKNRLKLCCKFPTLKDHQEYFSKYCLREETMHLNIDYQIAKIPTGGLNIDYYNSVQEVAIPIPDDVEQYEKMRLLTTSTFTVI